MSTSFQWSKRSPLMVRKRLFGAIFKLNPFQDRLGTNTGISVEGKKAFSAGAAHTSLLLTNWGFHESAGRPHVDSMQLLLDMYGVGHGILRCGKRGFLSRFIQKTNICQDRLGTNIGGG
eukprot:COSAG06_NODE_134_length_22423_cov_17.315445_22_plen_119_part_00